MPDFSGLNKKQRLNRIHDEYECIRYDIRRAFLFGDIVDPTKSEQVVVAAYYLGKYGPLDSPLRKGIKTPAETSGGFTTMVLR